jgi:hypothetical protein
VLAGYYAYELRLKANPPIHEVATDWERPVTFSSKLITARGPSAHPVEDSPYVGRNVAYEWAGQSLAAIVSAVEATAAGIAAIAASTESQSANATEVTMAIRSVSHTTESNAAAAEEMAASAEQLGAQAQGLRDLVKRFKV